MTDSVLELDGVTKTFKAKTVLNRIGLTLEPGRVVGLLGKNGAGKTTLIKCAMGLLRVSSGSAKVFGEDSWSLRGSWRESAERVVARPVASSPHLKAALSKNFLWIALRFLLVVLLARFAFAGAIFAEIASILPLMPIVIVAAPFKVLQRIFMLPMRRVQTVRHWGAEIFLTVLKYWAAIVLPLCLVTLLAPPPNTTRTFLPWMLAVTFAAQLPLFGAAMALLSFKTRTADVRYSIILVLLPFALPIVSKFAYLHQTIPASLLLGTILIGWSYRRWCTVEIG
jgi:energy-coupling factor transporter ATP-binding protein EcfA2